MWCQVPAVPRYGRNVKQSQLSTHSNYYQVYQLVKLTLPHFGTRMQQMQLYK
jgi:hypothetical protein